MLAVDLERFEWDDDGTYSVLKGPAGFSCYAGELPLRLDQKGKRLENLGRIAPGIFRCSWAQSPSRKNPNGTPEYTYKLEQVPDAEGVLIHSGNFCGDIKKEERLSDVQGCIILGRAILDIEIPETKRLKYNISRKKQKGVSSSHDAVSAFVNLLEKKPFMLTIKENFK